MEVYAWASLQRVSGSLWCPARPFFLDGSSPFDRRSSFFRSRALDTHSRCTAHRTRHEPPRYRHSLRLERVLDHEFVTFERVLPRAGPTSGNSDDQAPVATSTEEQSFRFVELLPVLFATDKP